MEINEPKKEKSTQMNVWTSRLGPGIDTIKNIPFLTCFGVFTLKTIQLLSCYSCR